MTEPLYVISESELEHIMDDVEVDKHYKAVRSHPLESAIAEYNKDVIEELERLRDAPLQTHWRERSNSINISDAISFIKNGVQK